MKDKSLYLVADPETGDLLQVCLSYKAAKRVVEGRFEHQKTAIVFAVSYGALKGHFVHLNC